MNKGTPLVPPGREVGFANHHWVQRIDSDGRSMGLEVYQWQPSSKKWCRPNFYAIGEPHDKDLEGYEYVAICPTPPNKEEVDEFRRIMDWMPVSLKQQPEYHTFLRLIAEHVYVLPRK